MEDAITDTAHTSGVENETSHVLFVLEEPTEFYAQ
jgi:hypothetical protein